jgi:ABC-type bacteriocin/lantibiotic exporter with double-glycine peptidase domain
MKREAPVMGFLFLKACTFFTFISFLYYISFTFTSPSTSLSLSLIFILCCVCLLYLTYHLLLLLLMWIFFALHFTRYFFLMLLTAHTYTIRQEAIMIGAYILNLHRLLTIKKHQRTVKRKRNSFHINTFLCKKKRKSWKEENKKPSKIWTYTQYIEKK